MVSYIRHRTLLQQWRYVATKENPADDASRGMHIKAFMHSKRWIAGPSFLWRAEDYQSAPKEEIVNMHDGDPEIKKDFRVNTVILQGRQNASNCFITYFSDWKKLKVAVAWILKVKKLLNKICLKRKELLSLERNCNAFKTTIDAQMKMVKATLGGQSLSLEDLFEAEMAIVRFSQQQEFQDENQQLKHGSCGVKKESSIYRLDPLLDDTLIRVGGRLRKAAMPIEFKHPIILSKNHHISNLLLRHIHEQLGHCGRNHMLSKLRQTYWITNANAAARKVISKCIVCRRYRGKTGEQKMSDLPL